MLRAIHQREAGTTRTSKEVLLSNIIETDFKSKEFIRAMDGHGLKDAVRTLFATDMTTL